MSRRDKKPTVLFAPHRRYFPDPSQAMDDGLVTIADELNVDILLEAYSFGIFPWPHDFMPIMWFSPDPRGIIDFNEFHISKSTKKFMRKVDYKVTFNTCFSKVIHECAEVPRGGQAGTWITSHIIQAYEKFHQAGYAHSVECWEGDELVGGLYGVFVGGVFAGESMFHKKDNASKICLIELVSVLKANGLKWMDVQMVTENVQQMGGKYIDRSEFLSRLEEAKLQAQPITFL